MKVSVLDVADQDALLVKPVRLRERRQNLPCQVTVDPELPLSFGEFVVDWLHQGLPFRRSLRSKSLQPFDEPPVCCRDADVLVVGEPLCEAITEGILADPVREPLDRSPLQQ